MSGCGHLDTQPVGRPRRLWGISVATCSIAQEDTSSVHRFDLAYQPRSARGGFVTYLN